MQKKTSGMIVGIVFVLVAALILTVGMISDFTVLSSALAVLLILTGIQIARGKM